jgi:hypothetical protein
MFTNTTVALAIIIGVTSGALAAEKKHSVTSSQDTYARGTNAGTDPDPNVRFELQRDGQRGRY